jgi:hypothetical protein
MIRFVDVGRQLGLDEEWPRQFAFFNTVTDTFVSFRGIQVWDSRANFELDFDYDSGWKLSRFTEKIPDDWGSQ